MVDLRKGRSATWGQKLQRLETGRADDETFRLCIKWNKSKQPSPWNFWGRRFRKQEMMVHLILCSALLCPDVQNTNDQPLSLVWDYYFYAQQTFFFLICRAAPAAYGSSQVRGQIRALAAGLHHSHSNTRSPTHWSRPGIKPTSSWILAGSVSAVPQWELPHQTIFKDLS